MAAQRLLKWKVVAAIVIGSAGLFAAYLWPRVPVAIVLLSHDALAQDLMQDGWLAESRQQFVTIQHAFDASNRECSLGESVEWDGLIVAYDDSIFKLVEAAPNMARLITIDDRVQITLMKSTVGPLIRPLYEHPRLAKLFNARFESGSRFDVLVAALQSGERSPFFSTSPAHFEREWLARLKATALRVGMEDGVSVVEYDGARAIVPRDASRAMGVDLYVDGADRFFDVVIRGAEDSAEAIEALGCIGIKPVRE